MEFRVSAWDLAGAGTPGCVKGDVLPATILFDALTRTVTEKCQRVNLTDLLNISVNWIETATVTFQLKKHHKARHQGVAVAAYDNQ